MLEVLERSFNRILDGAWSCSYLGLMVCVYFLGLLIHLGVFLSGKFVLFIYQWLENELIPPFNKLHLTPQVVISCLAQATRHQVPRSWGQIKRLVSEGIDIVRRHGGVTWWLINCLWVCWLFFLAKWAQFMLTPIGLIFRIPLCYTRLPWWILVLRFLLITPPSLVGRVTPTLPLNGQSSIIQDSQHHLLPVWAQAHRLDAFNWVMSSKSIREKMLWGLHLLGLFPNCEPLLKEAFLLLPPQPLLHHILDFLFWYLPSCLWLIFSMARLLFHTTFETSYPRDFWKNLDGLVTPICKL